MATAISNDSAKGNKPPALSLFIERQMSEFLKTRIKNAARRWKKAHDKRIQKKLQAVRAERKERDLREKQEATELARKVPMDMLAKEWLKDTEATADVRAYLVEKLLPTLILGIEKLLTEVGNRNLIDTQEPSPNFNPINFIAQYLMRNNPRYSNFSEASPYIRGLRQVAEDLRNQVFSYEDNRLAQIKAEARRKREEREQQERMAQVSGRRRIEALAEQYEEWVDCNKSLTLKVVQELLLSFTAVYINFPENLKQGHEYVFSAEVVEDVDQPLSAEEFSTYVDEHVQGLSQEAFFYFMEHLSKCATDYRIQSYREELHNDLRQLFITCDKRKNGYIDRQELMALFESYYFDADERIQQTLKWPITEADLDDIDIMAEDPSSLIFDSTDIEESYSSSNEIAKGKDIFPATVANTTSELNEGADQSQNAAQSTVAHINEAENATEATTVDVSKEDTIISNDGKEQTEQTPIEVKSNVEMPESEEISLNANISAEVVNNDATITDSTNQDVVNKDESQDLEEKNNDVKSSSAASIATDVGNNVSGSASEKERSNAAEVKDESDSVTQDNNEGSIPETDKKNISTDEDNVQDGIAEPENEPSSISEENKVETELKERISSAQSARSVDGSNQDKDESITDKVAEVEEIEKENDREKTNNNSEAEASSQQDHDSLTQEQMEKGDVAEEGAVEEMLEANISIENATENELPKNDDENSEDADSHVSGGRITQEQFVRIIEIFIKAREALEKQDQMFIVKRRAGKGAGTRLSLMELKKAFFNYIQDSLIKSEPERRKKLDKAMADAKSARRRLLIQSIFDMWDNEGCGTLDLDEINNTLENFDDGTLAEALREAMYRLSNKVDISENKLTKQEYYFYMDAIRDAVSEETFDKILEHMKSNLERSAEERRRGEARKRWLQQVAHAGRLSGISLDPVFKAAFAAIQKDAEAHGKDKKVSANIAMLEKNVANPARGEMMLKYVAATIDDQHYVVGRCLYPDTKGISFQAIDSGKPIFVPRVQNHLNVHFWNEDHRLEMKDGSYIVIPLKDRHRNIYGVIGLDTLGDPHNKVVFMSHEITFYQGLAKAVSAGYQHVDLRRKTLRIAESAVTWIHRRSPSIHETCVYLVEHQLRGDDYLLCKMLATSKTGDIQQYNSPEKLRRRENLFRDYLFKCADERITVTASAYGEKHTAFPLCNSEGAIVAVIDINLGILVELPQTENREVQRLIKLLNDAHKEVDENKDDTAILALEKRNADSRIEVLFDRLMLIDLRKSVSRLDARAFAELKSYKDPPKTIHIVLKTVVSMFYEKKDEQLENWKVCRQYVSPELVRMVTEFDPTGQPSLLTSDEIRDNLKDVPHGTVMKHGSLPAHFLYNWAFVCLSLMEHADKMGEVVPPKSATSHTIASVESQIFHEETPPVSAQ